MIHKTAILEIRHRLDIPEAGFPDEKKALRWYKDHFQRSKGINFRGSFGFRYEPMSDIFDFEYKSSPKGLWIASPYPLDQEVPLDREVAYLANEAKVPKWGSPALRLVVLIGELPESLEFRLPYRFIAPLGNFRVLIHPVDRVSRKYWRNTGEMMGLLPSEVDMWQVPGTITIYRRERKNKKEQLYQQVLSAYHQAIGERRMKGKMGRWGLLLETGQILKDNYGWESPLDSYTVRRYLDRAEKIWHISTR